MAKIKVEEQPEYSTLPVDSILHVKVDELTVKEVDGANGKWEKLEFKFKILGIQATGDGSSVEDYEDLIAGPIWGSVPFRLTDHPENKLRLWAEAILGMELGVGYELDTDHFKGRECRALTDQYASKGRDKFGNKIMKHQVTSLLQKAPDRAAPQQQQQQNPWTPQQPAPQPVGAGAQDPWATPGVSADEPPF